MTATAVTLAVSMGDCNGIGLEVFIGAVRRIRAEDGVLPTFVLAAHAEVVQEYCALLGVPCAADGPALLIIDGVPCRLLPCAARPVVEPGVADPRAGALAWEALETVIAEVQAGRADAILTLPVSKATLKAAGYPFPGQTELFAARCGAQNAMMILCTTSVRVGLVSIHIPLAQVPAMITHSRVLERIRSLHRSLTGDFGCVQPRLAVLGLNPHAGEGGDIGREEIETIIPAMEEARAEGLQAEGPFPADGFFAHGAYAEYDGILAMYHDQGLIPLKMLARGGGVNITAGLPIVRTSPDHGTAYAIAGRSVADPASTVEAIRMACAIAGVRHRQAHSFQE